jgi:hypothetical protein
MIESYYWKEDLLKLAKRLRPIKRPPRWTERLQVNFEKEVIISFFMIRKLIESTKLSSKTTKLNAPIFRSPCVAQRNSQNFMHIYDLYDFELEERVEKNVNFLCNQLIHGGATFAYRDKNRNWGGIYTCSDFERAKYVYRIPLDTIISILETAGNDYPSIITIEYCDYKNDYVVEIN